MDDALTEQSQPRREAARRELDALAHGGHRSVLLRIDCPHSHHVARVVQTAGGPVYETTPHAYAHGDRDRYDGPHHGHERLAWVDFLDGSEDPLPAGCECGPRSLARVDVRRKVAAEAHRWVLDERG